MRPHWTGSLRNTLFSLFRSFLSSLSMLLYLSPLFHPSNTSQTHVLPKPYEKRWVSCKSQPSNWNRIKEDLHRGCSLGLSTENLLFSSFHSKKNHRQFVWDYKIESQNWKITPSTLLKCKLTLKLLKITLWLLNFWKL